jgi:GNAT superfamily N-acetyltransferase
MKSPFLVTNEAVAPDFLGVTAKRAMTAMDDTQTTENAVRGMIRKVLRSETHLIDEHLLRLENDARHRRFGHDVSDQFVHDYAVHAADYGNLTFGYFQDGDIRAIAELRQSGTDFGHTAEVAFSVERDFSNKGIGTNLMGRIIRSARNRGIRHLLLVCLVENIKMQAIARHYGADLRIEDGSIVADIIPKRADYASMASEYLDDRMVFVQAALDLQTRLARMT